MGGLAGRRASSSTDMRFGLWTLDSVEGPFLYFASSSGNSCSRATIRRTASRDRHHRRGLASEQSSRDTLVTRPCSKMRDGFHSGARGHCLWLLWGDCRHRELRLSRHRAVPCLSDSWRLPLSRSAECMVVPVPHAGGLHMRFGCNNLVGRRLALPNAHNISQSTPPE